MLFRVSSECSSGSSGEGVAWEFSGMGSTKSLLIFGRNLREGIPTLSTAEFPHRGGYSTVLPLGGFLGVLEPSAQVLPSTS